MLRLVTDQKERFTRQVFSGKIVFAVLLMLATLLPATLHAQDKPITLSFNQVPLETVFKSISKQSGYTFLYNDEVKKEQRVSVSYSGSSVAEAVKATLASTSISYKIQGSRIVLFIQKQDQADTKNKVRIKVLDAEGQSLPGATVSIDGTSEGTMTNVDGIAHLSFANSNPKQLRISFIGMNSEVVAWTGASEIVCQLKEDSKKLEEVVITGFATISKERSTGATTTIKSSDLEKNINFNLTSSLEGKVAGLNTYNGSAVIRGVSSFNNNYNPLLVIDGLPVEGSLNDINPQDVENVTVLKDAASASIYGSKAGNGVIVVTTKSGKKGQASITFSANFSITPQKRISDYGYASTSQIIDYERAYLENNPTYIKNPLKYFTDKDNSKTYYSLVEKLYYDQLAGKITADELEASIATMKQNDYRKEYERLIWQNSIKQQYYLAFRKGADKSDMSFSVNYERQKYGTVTNNSDGLTLNLKNQLAPYKWMTINYGVYTSFYKGKAGLGQGDPTDYMPYEQILDANGNRNDIITINQKHNATLSSTKGLYGMVYNPLTEMDLSYQRSDNLKLRAFTELDLKLYKGLSYNFKFQYQHDNMEQENAYLKGSLAMRDLVNRFAVVSGSSIKYNIPDNGKQTSSRFNNHNYTVRNQLNYNNSITQDLALSIFAGTEFRESKGKGLLDEIYGYDPNVQLLGQSIDFDALRKGISGGALFPETRQYLYASQGNIYSLNREFSMYANGSLSYKGKYTLAGSWRVDQANLFGVAEENKFRPLWSVSGNWNVSEEDFMKDASWLNLLKLRASWGINGNADRETSPYMLATLGRSMDVNALMATISTPPNPDLRWEKTEILNIGVDFRTLNNKLAGTLDFYNKYTSDLIAIADLDPSTGFVSAKYNNGEMLNRGFEATLSYDWVRSKTWSATTSFVFAYNKNEVKKVDRNPSVALDLINKPTEYYMVGYPYNSLYAYKYAGITTNGDPSVYDKNGNVIENSGVMRDVEALAFMGTFDPKVTGSLSQMVRYKNLTLDALVVFYGGHKLRKDVVSLYGGASSSMSDGIDDRWTVDNQGSEIPRFPVYDKAGDRAKFWKYADKHIVSSGMVKLRNVGLGYNLNGNVLSKLKLQSLQVKAQVNNLCYWSAAGDGIDPENYNAKEGYRTGANKPTYILGINVTF